MRSAEGLLRTATAALAVAMVAGCTVLTGPATPKAEQPALPPAAAKPAAPAKADVAKDAARDVAKDGTKGPATASTAKAAPQAESAPPVEVEPAVSLPVRRAFEAARQALITNRLDDAERGFLALAKSNPELGGPHANLGIVYRQRQKLTESVAALERAVQASPKQAVYFNQLGISYRMVGQFTKAKEAYEKAIELDPNYALAHLNLGILYDVYLWDGRRALELYDRYLSLSPAGDEKVKKWATDLRNRNPPQRSLAVRKDQG
jgi:tetratricopeptide (TPR) repeat protein